MEEWVNSVELKLGPRVSPGARHKVLCLLYHYRHLNGTDLRNFLAKNFIVHKVRVDPNAKFASNIHQKRWPIIIGDGLARGINELTELANGRMSLWNTRPVIVDKVENFTLEDESRVMLDYSKVPEILLGAHLELSSKDHDNLLDSRHCTLFVADLKHAYLTIELHPEDRHYFAFTILRLGQLQPKRM